MANGKRMDSCCKFVKYSMFVSNFVILLGGFAIVGIGAWTMLDKAFIEDILGTNMYMGAIYILVGTGSVIIVISFLGCAGAVKEIKCMLLLYFIIVLIIFVTLVIGGILGYVFRRQVHVTAGYAMQSSLKMYTSSESLRGAWDMTQTSFKCCGVNTYEDWMGRVPNSCCLAGPDGKKLPCDVMGADQNNTFSEGCLGKLEVYVNEHAAYIGGAALGVSSIMILGMVFSCSLFKLIE